LEDDPSKSIGITFLAMGRTQPNDLVRYDPFFMAISLDRHHLKTSVGFQAGDEGNVAAMEAVHPGIINVTPVKD